MRALRSTLLILLAGCASGGAATTPPSSLATAVATPARDSRTSLAQFVDSMVSAPQFRSAHWGVLVVDPGRGETLYAHNADKLFVPASNMKLVTGVTALTRLGADFRWATTLLARGAVRDGVLDGDLVVRGNGDPSISAHARGDALAPLRALA
ncbi:MAG: D-alanyl-D-alanine carboxypeptidase/D-alanyl-D-alanine-endopeptidase, partial [Gemmatimonadetes bacterium]|nr:D-alanyl-D-alanine carboxypeptidase/D-alanyl-D-alanine-endopeptidase [Gemmatimonadota bacterium]